MKLHETSQKIGGKARTRPRTAAKGIGLFHGGLKKPIKTSILNFRRKGKKEGEN